MWRGSRALRLLLLSVLALALLQYFYGSVMENVRQIRVQTTNFPTRLEKKIAWPKRIIAKPLEEQQGRAENSSAEQDQTLPLLTYNNEIHLNYTYSNEIGNASVDVVHNFTTNNVTQDPIVTSPLPATLAPNGSAPNGSAPNNSAPCVITTELGPIPVNKSSVNLDSVELLYPEVRTGGRYSPPDCTPKYKVAIIIPFRDREPHLAIFLKHMHPFLMIQKIDYGIFVIEQADKGEFNRGKLMNVGFVIANEYRQDGWDCYIFHDVDLLPMDTRNLYTCPRQPRHMSVAIDKLHYRLPYQDIFGGVSALTRKQFEVVNGFPNKYWGWGGEDDDMSFRVRKRNYHVARYPMSIGRYTMLEHKKQPANPKRYKLLKQAKKMFQKDGLSNLQFKRISVTERHLYTLALVDIEEKS